MRMSGDRGSKQGGSKQVRGKALRAGKPPRQARKKSRACAGGAQSRASRGIGPADRGKTVARQTAFDLIGHRQSAKPESPARGGQATLWVTTRLYANPFHRPGILLKLLRQDFRGRIRGIMAPGA